MLGPMPHRSVTGRCLIALGLVFFVMACVGQTPKPNPMVTTDVQPTTDTPITGGASLSQVSPDTLRAGIIVQPATLPPLAAEVRRGDCTSEVVVARLAADDAYNRFSFNGNIEGTLASTLPVAIVLLDARSGIVIACGAFPGAP